VAWWHNAQGIWKGDEHPACTPDQDVAEVPGDLITM